MAVANLSSNDQNDNQVQNSFVLDYNVLNWLRFRQTISFQYLNRKRNQYLPSDAIGTDWLNDLTIKVDQGITTLTGTVADQPALHGLLVKIRDLGLPLLSVEYIT